MKITSSLCLLVLATLSCNRQLSEPVVQPQHYAITDALEPTDDGASIEQMRTTIAPYAEQLEERMNRVVGQVALPLTKGRPESSLGNWMADLLEAAAGEAFPDRETAFAVQNYGGIRVSEIGPGPLLVSELYELMPFDNQLVLVELSGGDVRAFVEHTLADGGWPVSRGLSVVERTTGHFDIEVQGTPLEEAATYYVALPDYVANGGDDSAMLVGKPQQSSNRMIRDLLIEYAEKDAAPISVTANGSRIKFAQ